MPDSVREMQERCHIKSSTYPQLSQARQVSTNITPPAFSICEQVRRSWRPLQRNVWLGHVLIVRAWLKTSVSIGARHHENFFFEIEHYARC